MPNKQEDEQYLYLMCNVMGLYKIGISVNPEERANQVKNSSGVPVVVTAVWRTSCEARTMESLLHKEFSSFRQQGEWFSFPSEPTKYIELCMRATHYSAIKLYDNPHGIMAMNEIRNGSPATKPWHSLVYKDWYVDLFDL